MVAPEPREVSQRAADWTRLHRAVTSGVSEPVRAYDRRYDRSEFTHERARSEASQAAALAHEYTSQDADARAGPSEPSRAADEFGAFRP